MNLNRLAAASAIRKLERSSKRIWGTLRVSP
jgi:hypothetical protein